MVAAKISKNKKFDVDNANVEIKLLKKLNSVYSEDERSGFERIVKFNDSFKFR